MMNFDQAERAAQWNALADVFGEAWRQLRGSRRAVLFYDVLELAAEDGLGPGAAARLLSDRIGGARALASYAESLAVRKLVSDAAKAQEHFGDDALEAHQKGESHA